MSGVDDRPDQRLDALNTKVDAMTSNGYTNQAIGLAWAWHALPRDCR